MNARAWILVLIGSVATVFGTHADGASNSSEALVNSLQDPNPSVRRQAAKALLPPELSQLEPSQAMDAILVAIDDSDAWVKQCGLGAIVVLANMAGLGGRNSDPRDGHIARQIYEPPELKLKLVRIVREDLDPENAIAAATTLMAAWGTEPEMEEAVLDRVDALAKARDQLRLLRVLSIGGLDDQRSRDRVAGYLKSAPVPVQHQAMQLLLAQPQIPAELFDPLMRLLETPETFADPLLLQALSKFSVSPQRYVPRLLKMQERLELELAKPPEQRMITVYNDAFVRSSLEEEIARARTRAH